MSVKFHDVRCANFRCVLCLNHNKQNICTSVQQRVTTSEHLRLNAFVNVTLNFTVTFTCSYFASVRGRVSRLSLLAAMFFTATCPTVYLFMQFSGRKLGLVAERKALLVFELGTCGCNKLAAGLNSNSIEKLYL